MRWETRYEAAPAPRARGAAAGAAALSVSVLVLRGGAAPRQSSADAQPRWAQHPCGQWAAGGAGEEAPALAELWGPLSPTPGAAV